VNTKVLRPFPGEEMKIDSKGTIVEIDLPDGYRRVWKGITRKGDMHLHWSLFQEGGVISWVDVDPKDTDDAVYTYALLIRPDAHLGEGPDKPCDACGLHARDEDTRFCWRCIYHEMHKRRPGVTI
jgi:hypothetical protein